MCCSIVIWARSSCAVWPRRRDSALTASGLPGTGSEPSPSGDQSYGRSATSSPLAARGADAGQLAGELAVGTLECLTGLAGHRVQRFHPAQDLLPVIGPVAVEP